MMKQRWIERTLLLCDAADFMLRCIQWPGEQDEDFNLVLLDMGEWLHAYSEHASNLVSDVGNTKEGG